MTNKQSRKTTALAREVTDSEGTHWTAHVTFSNWIVRTRWDLVGTRPEPTSVTIEAAGVPAVTASAVRVMPLGDLLDQSRQAVNRTALVLAAAQEQLMGRPRLGARTKAWASSGPKRGQRIGMEDLQRVAEVYREAWIGGVKPVNEAVREAFTLSQGGAAKRIMKAREAGLLDGLGRAKS